MEESREKIFCHIKRPSERLLKEYSECPYKHNKDCLCQSCPDSFFFCISPKVIQVAFASLYKSEPVGNQLLTSDAGFRGGLRGMLLVFTPCTENSSATFIKTKGLSQLSFVPRDNTTRYSLLSPSSPYSLFCLVYPRVHSL